ncbi:MAG: SAM-dependent chlorinase/fluorinase [Magnetococcales bacterium]|nr:SAM-dependent chlorinase/fluorinase [Magnetococcales bacterium]MBF0321990.1 SAM-dependent chlorinase/fluorinase [Magnetococcales bacterium]
MVGQPPVVLLTDFGSTDPYVGQIKGVLYRNCPNLRCIDLYHDVPPFAVHVGAWMIGRTMRFMPFPAIWFCVVDPGVGGQRRILLVQSGGMIGVGPDNGLLEPFLLREDSLVYSVDLSAFAGSSTTFQGRDIMAPVVGQLLNGYEPWQLGKPVGDPQRLVGKEWEHMAQNQWETHVMLVDRFGNLVTGLPANEMAGIPVVGWIDGQPCGVQVATFSDLRKGEVGLVAGGFGTMEVVVNQGSAALRYQAGIGTKVTLRVSVDAA